jgi:hypothetical protein
MTSMVCRLSKHQGPMRAGRKQNSLKCKTSRSDRVGLGTELYYIQKLENVQHYLNESKRLHPLIPIDRPHAVDDE